MTMDPQTVIARRIALELRDGMLVNLGIGIPTLVANYVPPGMHIFFQSENGLIGTGPIPEETMAQPRLTDAAGKPVSAIPGACTFDSAMSFGLIRGGHVHMTVLGGLQVDEQGQLANWMIPGKMVPGMGGAMDLVSGAKRVVVAMQHTAKGKPKILKRCTLPLTSVRRVDLVVTELAAISFADGKPTLVETAPGVSVEQVLAATEASRAPDAKLAIDLFAYRVGRELGSLAAALGGIDAIVFTAGIGENSRSLRERVCRDASWLGIELDTAANQANGPKISTSGSRVAAWVIPTNEELMIARHTQALLSRTLL